METWEIPVTVDAYEDFYEINGEKHQYYAVDVQYNGEPVIHGEKYAECGDTYTVDWGVDQSFDAFLGLAQHDPWLGGNPDIQLAVDAGADRYAGLKNDPPITGSYVELQQWRQRDSWDDEDVDWIRIANGVGDELYRVGWEHDNRTNRFGQHGMVLSVTPSRPSTPDHTPTTIAADATLSTYMDETMPDTVAESTYTAALDTLKEQFREHKWN